jgi:hypothetical protein
VPVELLGLGRTYVDAARGGALRAETPSVSPNRAPQTVAHLQGGVLDVGATLKPHGSVTVGAVVGPDRSLGSS